MLHDYCAAAFFFFLSQKKLLQPFATEMLHKHFINTRNWRQRAEFVRVSHLSPSHAWKRQWWHTVFELRKLCRGRGQRWLSFVCHVTDHPWPALLYESCQLNATLTEMPPLAPLAQSFSTHGWPTSSSEEDGLSWNIWKNMWCLVLLSVVN